MPILVGSGNTITNYFGYFHDSFGIIGFSNPTVGVSSAPIIGIGSFQSPLTTSPSYFASSFYINDGRILVSCQQQNINDVSVIIRDLEGYITGIGSTCFIAPYGDNHGSSVAIGDGRMVIGMSELDTNGTKSGGAKFYDYEGNELAEVQAPTPVAYSEFGSKVAIGCSRVVISTGQVSFAGIGTVSVYDLDGSFIKELVFPNIGYSGYYTKFGSSISVGCGRIVVGAQDDDSNGSNAGSAHVYDLNGNHINTMYSKYKPSSHAHYGTSVAVGCGKIVVGSPGGNGESYYYPKPANDDIDYAYGCVYLYDLNGRLIKLLRHPCQAGISTTICGYSINYGCSVSISDGRIYVAASGYDNIGGTNYGREGNVTVFDLNGNYLQSILNQENPSIGPQFGANVTSGCGRLAVHKRKTGGNNQTGEYYLYKVNKNFDSYFDDFIKNYKYY